MPTTDFQTGTTITKEWLNEADDHIFDQTGSKHSAAHITNTPSGNLASTDVQAAINELDTEKAKAGVNTDITSLAAGLVLAGAPVTGDSSLKVPTTGWVSSEFARNVEGAVIYNLGISVTLNSGAATVTITGKDGNALSATNPGIISFRDNLAGSDKFNTVSITAPLSVTIPSGATLGTVNGVYSRIWIVAYYYSGTVYLGVTNRVTNNTEVRVDGLGTFGNSTTNALTNVTIINTSSDSEKIIYGPQAATGVPYTILGFFDSNQATAGTWSTNPVTIAVNPRNRPGDVLNVQFVTAGTLTGTSTIPDDDTVPTSGEGDVYLSCLSVLRGTEFAANVALIEAVFPYSNSANVVQTLSLICNGGTTEAAVQGKAIAAGVQNVLVLRHARVANQGSNQYELRSGGATAGTTTSCGVAGARKLGGVQLVTLTITTISA